MGAGLNSTYQAYSSGAAAIARLGHFKFGDIVLADSLGHRLDTGATDKRTDLDVLTDKVIFSGIDFYDQVVGRKFGLGRYLDVFSGWNFSVRETCLLAAGDCTGRVNQRTSSRHGKKWRDGV